VRQFLIELAGEEALHVLKEFTQPMSDEELARRCKIKVSNVRAVLNKLHYKGIADYERTRDSQSGWYSYTWRVDLSRVMHILTEQKRAEQRKYEEMAAYERSFDFFACSKCAVKLPFEAAMDALFKCPGCGGNLSYVEKPKLPPKER